MSHPDARQWLTVGVATLGASILLFGLLPLTRRWIRRLRSARALKDVRLSFAGTVGELNIYPAKSFKRIPRSSIHCGALGVSSSSSSPLIDRGLLVVFGEDHRFVTMRQEPTLVLIEVSFNESTHEVTFSAPTAASPLTFVLPSRAPSPKERIATKVFGVLSEGLDCGETVADWLSRFLGKPGHRMIYRAPSALTDDSRGIAETIPHSDIDGKNLKYRHIAYQDEAPVLVTNASSLTALNSRLEEKITMRRFRPNIVVEGPAAWEEDEWDLLVFCPKDVNPNLDHENRHVVLRRVTPSMRCMVTTVNPDLGVVHPQQQPLATLREFRPFESAIGKFDSNQEHRRKPVFGNCMGVVVEGDVREGDAVWVVKKKWNYKG